MVQRVLLGFSSFQGCRQVLLVGRVRNRGSGGQKTPSGVQRQRPGKGSGGQSPKEADAVL